MKWQKYKFFLPKRTYLCPYFSNMNNSTIIDHRTIGFIFAAGLGTRLYPLTKDKPKALVEVDGKTLLEHTINKLINAGIRRIVVNVHHFSNLIKDFIATHNFDAEIVISDESEALLDTAGGLKFAEPLLSDCDQILLHNVDILSSIDLQKLYQAHIDSKAMATLAVKQRETSRYFRFNPETMQLCGWENRKTGEVIESRPCKNPISLAFSGIHIINRELIDYIPTIEKKSITPLYIELSRTTVLKGWLHQEDRWMDIGKYDDYLTLLPGFTSF